MPKIVDHRERRAEIADAVLAIIAEVGVDAVTIRDVATRCGWSTGVINHYVGGRAALLQLAFRRASWLSGETIDSIVSRPDLDPLGRLQEVLRSTLPFDARSIAMGRIYTFFYAEAAAKESLASDMRRYIDSWRDAIEERVTEVMRERQMPTTHAREIGNFLVALADGLGIHGILGTPLIEDGHLKGIPPIPMWIETALELAERLSAQETD